MRGGDQEAPKGNSREIINKFYSKEQGLSHILYFTFTSEKYRCGQNHCEPFEGEYDISKITTRDLMAHYCIIISQ